MRKILVEDYNPDWAKQFNQFKRVYQQKLKHIDVEIEHVGSTSVEGLAAKPIIDIDLIVKNEDDVKRVIASLKELGYVHQGDLGIKGREAFKRESDTVPYSKGHKTWCNHHLYVCVKGIASLENHLRLREYLRQNRDAVKAYSELKKKLASLYPYDIDSYIEGKTPYITSILSKVGMSNEIKEIAGQNKK